MCLNRLRVGCTVELLQPAQWHHAASPRLSSPLVQPHTSTAANLSAPNPVPAACHTQDLLRRLPEAMTPEDAALLEANPAYQHPLLAGAVILPGTGPHPIDYACTGEPAVLPRNDVSIGANADAVMAAGAVAPETGAGASCYVMHALQASASDVPHALSDHVYSLLLVGQTLPSSCLPAC